MSILADKVDVFALTEINITQPLTRQFFIYGYRSFFFTRDTGRGGGIAVFVKNNWASSIVSMSFVSAEHVAVSLHSAHFDLTLIVIYRPPRQNINVFIGGLSKASLPLGRMCLIGDINIELLKSKKQVTSEYLNTLADAGIAALINLPTRV